jgi:hypothetical protein
MFGEHLQDCEDQAARAKKCRATPAREANTWSTPASRSTAMALWPYARGIERTVEGSIQFEPEGDMAKLDELAAYRKSRH